MLLLAGVSIERLDRNTRRALQKVGFIHKKRSQEMVITSTFEGTHGDGSLHYANQAFDVRIPPRSALQIFREIKTVLGHDYDVVDGKHHFHIEYDPKG